MADRLNELIDDERARSKSNGCAAQVDAGKKRYRRGPAGAFREAADEAAGAT